MPTVSPRTSGSPPRMATTTPITPTAVQLMCQPVARSARNGPATSSTTPGCSVWMTASTATDECCSAANTNAMLIPNSAPASAVERRTWRETRPPSAYVSAHTIGTVSQNRTETPTSGGAVISFVTGGPRPQITTTSAIVMPASPDAGASTARPGGAAAVTRGNVAAVTPAGPA